MVREDAHVTYKDIEASLRTGSGCVAKILHIYLRVSKVSSHWVPHSLTDGQKVTRVERCCEKLQRFNNENSRHDSEIITGDETWIYQYDPDHFRRFIKISIGEQNKLFFLFVYKKTYVLCSLFYFKFKVLQLKS